MTLGSKLCSMIVGWEQKEGFTFRRGRQLPTKYKLRHFPSTGSLWRENIFPTYLLKLLHQGTRFSFHKARLKMQIPLNELRLWCDSKLQVSPLFLPVRVVRGDENTRMGKRAVNKGTETTVSPYLLGP